MARNNKTSANVVAWMTIEQVAPSGIELSQFSTDAGIVADAVQEVQAEMTLDGHLVAGYTPNPQVVSITLQPTSPAIPYIRELQMAQKAAKSPLEIGLTVYLPGTDKTYNFVRGFVTQMQAMPPINRVQDPLTIQITFEDCQ